MSIAYYSRKRGAQHSTRHDNKNKLKVQTARVPDEMTDRNQLQVQTPVTSHILTFPKT